MTYAAVVPVSGGKDSQACLRLAIGEFGADKVLAILEKHIKEHEALYHELGKDVHRLKGAELPEVTFDEWMGK